MSLLLLIIAFVAIGFYTWGKYLQDKHARRRIFGFAIEGFVLFALVFYVQTLVSNESSNFQQALSQTFNEKVVLDFTPSSTVSILTIKNSGLISVQDVAISIATYNVNSNLGLDYVFGLGTPKISEFPLIKPGESQTLNFNFIEQSSGFAPPTYQSGETQFSVIRITFRNSVNEEKYIYYYLIPPRPYSYLIDTTQYGQTFSGPIKLITQLAAVRKEIIQNQMDFFNDSPNDIYSNN